MFCTCILVCFLKLYVQTWNYSHFKVVYLQLDWKIIALKLHWIQIQMRCGLRRGRYTTVIPQEAILWRSRCSSQMVRTKMTIKRRRVGSGRMFGLWRNVDQHGTQTSVSWVKVTGLFDFPVFYLGISGIFGGFLFYFLPPPLDIFVFPLIRLWPLPASFLCKPFFKVLILRLALCSEFCISSSKPRWTQWLSKLAGRWACVRAAWTIDGGRIRIKPPGNQQRYELFPSKQIYTPSLK